MAHGFENGQILGKRGIDIIKDCEDIPKLTGGIVCLKFVDADGNEAHNGGSGGTFRYDDEKRTGRKKEEVENQLEAKVMAQEAFCKTDGSVVSHIWFVMSMLSVLAHLPCCRSAQITISRLTDQDTSYASSHEINLDSWVDENLCKGVIIHYFHYIF